ncbi:MAG: hypothetical protein DI535_19645 [Citrobacter freundii]|nr:MAG: hypothetical protein DI535_19645 [Citrobacter freundii]
MADNLHSSLKMIRMQSIRSSLAILFIAFLLSACSSGRPFATSPGQTKKATGSKSAKPFAPGQQKKHRW